MKTQTENVVCIYDEAGTLKGIIKADHYNNKTTKVIYNVEEAAIEDIELLINPDKTLI